MNVRLLFASAASLALAAAAGWYASRTVGASTPAPRAATTSKALAASDSLTAGPEPTLVVAQAAQRASGMMLAPVGLTTIRSEYDAYSTVVDPQPLFDLSTKLAGARADVATLTAQSLNSTAQYQRSQTLFDDDHNVSLKALQEAKALMQADQGKLQSAKATLAALNATTRMQFGDALARAAAISGSDLLLRLQAGRASILRVTLPARIGSAAPDRLEVPAPNGERLSAQKLSPSPLADPAVQGLPWFYLAQRALPVGMHMTLAAPASQASAPALLIPADAIVWYGGQTWAYVRIASDRFVRRLVRSVSETDAGVAVNSGFHAGDLVVTRGAQLLLSEELKPQGVATSCKDPPECDD
jgi:hypothetical protein